MVSSAHAGGWRELGEGVGGWRGGRLHGGTGGRVGGGTGGWWEGGRVGGEASRIIDGEAVSSTKSRPVLTNLSVRYEARRSGVGSKLVQACETRVLSQWNLHEIILEVEDDNELARDFYKRRGYKVLFEDPTCWMSSAHREFQHGQAASQAHAHTATCRLGGAQLLWDGLERNALGGGGFGRRSELS